MRILVVEDEPAAAVVLSKGLREHTYAVDVAADGLAARELANISDYGRKIDDDHRVKLLQTRRGAGYSLRAANDASAED
jgi:DNA-binding response OmpR family regulator